MSHPYKGFEPKWYQGAVPANCWRSIFKWGVPEQIKAPKEALYKLIKNQFGLSDDVFKEYSEDLGLDAVIRQAYHS
jgi:alkyldihydroxyacetonephosphate synthase